MYKFRAYLKSISNLIKNQIDIFVYAYTNWTSLLPTRDALKASLFKSERLEKSLDSINLILHENRKLTAEHREKLLDLVFEAFNPIRWNTREMVGNLMDVRFIAEELGTSSKPKITYDDLVKQKWDNIRLRRKLVKLK